MRKGSRRADSDEMRAEYDFSGGVRGKHAAQSARGSNCVVLDPDVVMAFPDGPSVNRALRGLLEVASRVRARKA